MILTRSILNRLVAQTKVLGAMGRRDRLIMQTLYEGKLTAAELIRIRRNDVDLRAKVLLVRGSRVRRVAIDRRLFNQITLYRDQVSAFMESGWKKRHALFLYDFDTPFTPKRLRAMLEHYRRAAGLDEDE